MSFLDLKISESAIQSTGVQSQPDTLTGSAADNKKVFDALPILIIRQFNLLLEALGGTGAASEVPIEPIDGMTATNVQKALAEISKNLADYVAKIKGAGGAAEVGVSAISGMSVSNTQQALAELKRLIDNLVIGTLPPGSVTANMIEDGAIVQLGALLAVAAAAAYDSEGSYAVGDYCTFAGKLHKCGTAIPDGEPWTAEHWTETSVAAELAEVHALLAPLGGATTPQAVIAALGAGVRDNEMDNPFFEVNQKGWTSETPSHAYSLDRYTSNDIQVEKLEHGVKLTPVSNTNAYFIQRVTEDKAKLLSGKKITLSVYIDEDNFYSGTVIAPAFSSGEHHTAVSFQEWSFRVFSTKVNSEYGFGLYPVSTESPSISPIALKAEFGENQTLAYKDENGKWHLLPQPDSDYATQLAKCQRYFRRFPANYAMGVSQAASSVKNACFRYECNPPMRTTPVTTMQNQSDLTGAIDDGNSPVTPTRVVFGWGSSRDVIGFYFEGASGNGGPGFVCNRYIDASAEL